MPRSRHPLWRRDSNQMASGKPRAVQNANQADRFEDIEMPTQTTGMGAQSGRL